MTRQVLHFRLKPTGLCVLVVAAAVAWSPALASASTQVQTTAAYLRADDALVRAADDKLGAAEVRLRGVLSSVRASCPSAAADSPEDEQSTDLSNELIGTMVVGSFSVFKHQVGTFLRDVKPLRWGNRRAQHEVTTYVTHLRAMFGLASPPLCADARAWAKSGFSALDSSTRTFAPRFMDVWVSIGEQPPSLRRIEPASLRALARRTAALEERFSEFEARAVETYRDLMNSLELWP